MIRYVLSVALGAGVAISQPSPVAAASIDDVLHRLDILEAENLRLKHRIKTLEGGRTSGPSRASIHSNEGRPALPSPRDTPSHADFGTDVIPASPKIWTGPYVGAAFGLAAVQAGSIANATSENTTQVTSGGQFYPYENTNQDFPRGTALTNVGATISINGGFNIQATPSVVIGAQLDGSLTNVSASERVTSLSTSNSVDPNSITASSTSSTSVGISKTLLRYTWSASALARAGVLLTPDNLLYGLAGWSYAQLENETALANLNGPTVGFGLESRLSDNWSFFTEYRYTDFDVARLRTNSGFGFNTLISSPSGGSQNFFSTATSNSKDVETDMHSLRIGVTRHFN